MSVLICLTRALCGLLVGVVVVVVVAADAATAHLRGSRSKPTATKFAREDAAPAPPRGWNSYDRFSWNVNETQFLTQCRELAKLKQHGYKYCVIDFRWYQDSDTQEYSFDSYGRPIPNPKKWPRGFKPVAEEVKALGLEFGVHIMKGALKPAILKALPVLGTNATLKDAVDESADGPCTWFPDFVGLKQNAVSAKFYESIFQQMVQEWGVSFVKHDCVFGGPSTYGEPGGWAQIQMASNALDKLVTASRPRAIYSLSPGDYAFKPQRLTEVGNYANMARLTEDVWDNGGFFYDSFALAAAATRVSEAAGLAHARRLPFFADLDMLPLGIVGGPDLPHPMAKCNLTAPQQLSMMTLWSISRSPLILGADLTQLDEFTLKVITNPSVLRVNTDVGFARGAPVAVRDMMSVWIVNYEDGTYVAVFDLSGKGLSGITVGFTDVGVGWGNTQCAVMDCWKDDCEKSLSGGGGSGGATEMMTGSLYVPEVEAYGVWFVKITNCKTAS